MTIPEPRGRKSLGKRTESEEGGFSQLKPSAVAPPRTPLGLVSVAVKYSLADEVLQDRRLAGTLATHHCNLGQVDGVGDAQLSEDVLQPVHDGDEGLHPLVARHGGALLLFPPIHVTLLRPPPLLPQVDSQLPGNMVPGGARRRRRRRRRRRSPHPTSVIALCNTNWKRVAGNRATGSNS